MRQIRWRVKRAFGLESVEDAKVGAITFIQRFDSALRLDPHYHCLVPDGAWLIGDGGEPRFCALGDPSPEDIHQVAVWTQARLVRVLEDGKIRYTLKKPWKNGTHAILLSPLDFIARLCALIPPPRFHMLHYAGVFSGGSALRQAIVPGRPDVPQPKPPIPLFTNGVEVPDAAPVPSRHPWAWLLARVFAVDVLKCPVRRCSGEMKILEIAKTPEHAARALASQGMGARSPTRNSRIPASQLALPFMH